MLDLSFLPWVLGVIVLSNMAAAYISNEALALLATLGVSTACNLYVFPYQQFTYAQWYQQLRSDAAPAGQVFEEV